MSTTYLHCSDSGDVINVVYIYSYVVHVLCHQLYTISVHYFLTTRRCILTMQCICLLAVVAYLYTVTVTVCRIVYTVPIKNTDPENRVQHAFTRASRIILVRVRKVLVWLARLFHLTARGAKGKGRFSGSNDYFTPSHYRTHTSYMHVDNTVRPKYAGVL